MGRAHVVVQLHQPSPTEQGAMERAQDVVLLVTVEDDLVIARRSDDATRDYAVELRILIRALADAMDDAAARERAWDRPDGIGDDTIREKAWDLAEFLIGTVPLSCPDWDAIELCSGELAELAGMRRHLAG